MPHLVGNGDTETVPQDYTTRRRLQAYVPIEDAHQAGETANIRIKAVWDVVDGGDPGQQCGFTGQVVAGPIVCSASDVVVPGGSKATALKNRVEWASRFLSDTLYVKPVQGSLNLATAASFAGVGTTFPDSDLVIIVTARPTSGNIAAFASCLQRDQHGRCILGLLNWSPAYLSASVTDPNVVIAEQETAVHEILHILGAVRPSRAFVGPDGIPIMQSSVSAGLNRVYVVDDGSGGTGLTPHYAKPTTWVVTPRVQALAREHFGCDSLIGMPLEDIPFAGGAGSHWEARVAGPEVMSYGGISGEVTLSDLTLALLEDTEQYRANYSMAGRLDLEQSAESVDGGCPESADTAVLDFVFGNTKAESEAVEPVTRAPGALRWGAGAGCGFVVQSAASWPSRYLCEEDRALSCTPDNRMSAVCTIRTDWSLPNTEVSYGDIRTAANTLANDDCPSGSNCPLPSVMRYFGTPEDAAARTGGFSQAMDFAPIKVGYWNCQDTSAKLQVVDNPEAGSNVNLTTLGYGRVVEESGLFGGQCRCPTCRCFASSLREVTSASIDATFQRYGLCYRSNCYRPDYLQVGIRDPFTGNLRWYRCPSDSRLHIPGFTGAFHCPDVEAFCRTEDITGVRYPEVRPWQLWVVLSVMLGLPLLLLIVCIFPCCRAPLVRRLKGCCGVTLLARKRTVWVEDAPSPGGGERVPLKLMPGVHSPATGRIVIGSPNGADDVVLRATTRIRRVRPSRMPGTILLAINSILFVVFLVLALCVVAFMVQGDLAWSSSPVALVAVFLTVLAAVGMAGARKRAKGLSCLIVTYFYGAVLTLVGVVITIVGIAAASRDLEGLVDGNWDFFEELYAGTYDKNDTREEQVADTADHIRRLAALYITFAVLFLSMLAVGVAASGRIMRRHNVAVITFCVLNHTMAVLGALLFLTGVLMKTTAVLGSLQDLEPVVGSIITAAFVAGVALAAVSLFGLRAAFGVRRSWLLAFACMAATGAAVAAIGCAVSANNAGNAEQRVAALSDEELAQIDTQRTTEQLESDVRAFYATVSVSCGVMAMFWLATLGSLAVFGQILGLWFVSPEEHRKKRQWRQRARGRPTSGDHRRAIGALSSVVPVSPAYPSSPGAISVQSPRQVQPVVSRSPGAAKRSPVQGSQLGPMYYT